MMDNQGGDQVRSMAKIRARSMIDINEERDKLGYDKGGDCVCFQDSPKNISGFAQDLDYKIKKLKRSLEGWREIVISTHSVLLWEKQWHPGALFGISTIIFLFLWLTDPSILTTISILGLIITTGDYLVPTVATSFFRNDNWTGTQEKRFDELCRSLVLHYTHFSTMMASFYLMRTVRPKVYYAILIVSLLIMAWLGSTVNNLLLTYITVTWFLLLPGMEQRGILCKYTQCICSKFTELLRHQGTTKND